MTKDLLTWDAEGVAAWEARASDGPRVLMHSLRGFIDAGKAGVLVADHILAESEPVRVATFDTDQLIDYRSRRPEMTFSVNTWTDYDEPHLALDMVTDATGRPFLFLHGFEPDIQWERYIREIQTIVVKLGVDLTLGAHGIPMATPHTRPITATVHGTSPDILPDAPSFFGTVTVPASASNLLEYRFGQWGLDAVNVAVHVPHYLAQSSFPQAAIKAMECIETASGLTLSPDALEDAARAAAEEIDRQVDGNEEVQSLVQTLEQQFDEAEESRAGVLPLSGSLPTADELGAEFEQFLADQGPESPKNS